MAEKKSKDAPPTARARERSHWCQASFVIVGEVMGAGVLGLPACLAQMGWLLGTAAVIFFGLCALYSGYLIAETRNRFHPRAGTFADIAEQLSRKLRGDDDDEDAVIEAESGGVAVAAGEVEAQGEESGAEKSDGAADEDETDDEGAVLLASSDGATAKPSSSSTALHISAVAEWCTGEDSAAQCCAKCAQVCGCGLGMSLLVGTTRWMMLLNWFIALPFFMMAAANSLSVALGFVPGAANVCTSVWTLVVGVLLLGISQVRDLHALSWVALASSIALLVAVVVMLVALGTQGIPNHTYEAPTVGAGSDPFRVMSAFGGIVWAWGGQAMFPEIMREMRDGRCVLLLSSFCRRGGRVASCARCLRTASVANTLPPPSALSLSVPSLSPTRAAVNSSRTRSERRTASWPSCTLRPQTTTVTLHYMRILSHI